MQIKLESDALQEAIRVISRLSPPVSGNISLQTNANKLFIVSNGETSTCSINVPCEVSGKENIFAVSLSALKDATKGRKELTILYDKTLCKISSKAYRCELATTDAIELDKEDEEKSKPIKITSEQATWLKSAISTVALKPTALLASYMPLSIKLTDKGAFVACYDTNHMAFLNSTEIKGDLTLNLPIDIFSAVLDAFNGSSIKLELSKSNLYVSNALIKVMLGIPQEDEKSIKIEEVIETAKGSKTSKGKEIEISKSALLAFLDNAKAIATKERAEIKMELEKGNIRLEVKTTSGTVKSNIAASCTDTGNALIDFEFLDEAVRKSAESVVMKLVDEQFILFKLKAGSVVVSLNQEN
jgi:hypothetical protein